jgi:ribonucleotide monophosphatase NagD (HAD superfamily)
MLEDVRGLLIDLDGVLYVEDQPIAGPRRLYGGCASAG